MKHPEHPSGPSPNTNPNTNTHTHTHLNEGPVKVLSQEELDKLKGNLHRLREQLDYTREYFQIVAKFKYAQYDAFRHAGFTPEQAMDLVKTTGLWVS